MCQLMLHLLIQEIAYRGNGTYGGSIFLCRTVPSALRRICPHGQRTVLIVRCTLYALHQFINAALLTQHHLFEKRYPLREFMNPCQFVRAHSLVLPLKSQSIWRVQASRAPRAQCAQ